MSLEQNFLYNNFQKYQELGIKALQQKKYRDAKRYLLKAAESLLKLAKMHKGSLRKKYEETANSIMQKALSINVDNGTVSRKNIPSDSNYGDNQELEEQGERSFESLKDIPDISFEDVIGLEDVKEYIKLNVIEPFRNPELYELFKKKAGGGLLLYGPPGTGKTMIAKAIANEVGAALYSIKASDITSKWFGETNQNIAALFKEVRSNDLAVLFIDEIEALTSKRSNNDSGAMSRAVSEFLTQLDGFNEASDSVVLFLAATNVPNQIDEAILRPGRFDRLIYVPLPNEEARLHILQLMLDGLPIDEDFDIEFIARLTDGYSGADLKGIVNYCKDKAIRRSIDIGEYSIIVKEDFLEALEQIRPSTTKDLHESYQEFKDNRS